MMDYYELAALEAFCKARGFKLKIMPDKEICGQIGYYFELDLGPNLPGIQMLKDTIGVAVFISWGMLLSILARVPGATDQDRAASTEYKAAYWARFDRPGQA